MKERMFVAAATSLWVLAPLALLVVGYLVSVKVPLTDSVDTWVSAETAPGTVSRPVEIALAWEPQASLRAPNWSGTVQKVYIESGSIIRSGDKVLRIGGVDRLAVASAEPFWRPITQGMVGSDVDQLNEVLGGLGLTHGTGSTADSFTAQGIFELAKKLGAAESRTFEPTWVLYLGTPSLTVADIKVDTAGPAPASGAEVATGSMALMTATVVEKGSIRQDSHSGTSESATDPGPVSGTSETSGIADGSGQGSSGTPVVVTGGAKLLSAGVVLNVSMDEKTNHSVIDAAGLEVLKKQAQPGAVSVAATIESPTTEGAVEVPGSALWSDGNGLRCIALKQPEGNAATVQVELLAGIGGKAVIKGSIRAGDKVFVSSKKELQCK
jgi:hypothetical protein